MEEKTLKASPLDCRALYHDEQLAALSLNFGLGYILQ
jgi:hypothetical protein